MLGVTSITAKTFPLSDVNAVAAGEERGEFEGAFQSPLKGAGFAALG
jgi:hypothetical protein